MTWEKSSLHCILQYLYNKICTTIIVHIILLILCEICSKGIILTSLLLIEVFAEVAKVNAEADDINSCQPWEKNCQGKAEAKCIFIWLPQHFICQQQKNAEIWGLKWCTFQNMTNKKNIRYITEQTTRN